MELSRLAHLRTIAPGMVVLIYSAPAYIHFQSMFSESFKSFGGAIVVAYSIGAVFNLLKCRSIINAETHKQITANIKQRLLKSGRTAAITSERKAQLLAGDQLMHVFYGFIDRDPSLKEKSKRVRHNGIVWTTTADIAALSIPFVVAYLFLASFFPTAIFFMSAIAIGPVGYLSGTVLHPLSVKRHIELGNDQLNYIEHHYLADLQTAVDAL